MLSYQIRRRGAFTLIELLATISIITVLVLVCVTYIGNYLKAAQKTSQEQALLTLNQALNTYRTLGGLRLGHSLQGENNFDKVQAILNTLVNGITVNNRRYAFLQASNHINASELYGAGQGKTYRFTGYGSTDTLTGTIPTDADCNYQTPLPDGVCVLTQPSGTFAQIAINTPTNYIAYQIDSGTTQITDKGSFTPNGSGTKLTFWSCAASNDSTASGQITFLGIGTRTLNSIRLDALKSLQRLEMRSITVPTIDVRKCTSLTYMDTIGGSVIGNVLISGNPSIVTYWNDGGSITGTLDASNCPNLTTLTWGWGNNCQTLNVSNCPKLATYNCGSTQIHNLNTSNSPLITLVGSNTTLDSLNIAGCPNITSLSVRLNNQPAPVLSSLTNLQYLHLNGITTSTLDLHSNPALITVECGGNIGTVDLRGCPNLTTLRFNDNVDTVNISGLTHLTTIWAEPNQINNLYAAGCTALNSYWVAWTSIKNLDLSNCTALNLAGLCCFGFQGNGSYNIAGATQVTNSASTLNAFYNNLPSCANGTLHIGSVSDQGDTSIATNKGWTVVN